MLGIGRGPAVAAKHHAATPLHPRYDFRRDLGDGMRMARELCVVGGALFESPSNLQACLGGIAGCALQIWTNYRHSNLHPSVPFLVK